MRKSVLSRVHALTLSCVAFAGAIACGSSGPTETASTQGAAFTAVHGPSSAQTVVGQPIGQTAAEAHPHSAESFELAASSETKKSLGIAHWKGGRAGDGKAGIEGVSATGEVRVMMIFALGEASALGSLEIQVQGNGVVEQGELRLSNREVVRNTLPASAHAIAAALEQDLRGAPRLEDAASCQQAALALSVARAALVAECYSGNLIGCAIATGAAIAAQSYYNIQCGSCGGSCPSGTTCDGSGTCVCQSQGCAGRCGNVVDNCGRTLYCGACACVSTGCQGQCGNIEDNCGNLISCGSCTVTGGGGGGGGGGGDDCDDEYCTFCDDGTCYC